MKKLWILCLVLALCLCACGQKTAEYTFPENSAILGVDLSGLSAEAAWSALQSAVENYTMVLTVDGTEATLTAKDIALQCSHEQFLACVAALEKGEEPDFTDLIRFSDSKFRLFISRHYNKKATNASLQFDESSDAYVLIPHVDGQTTSAADVSDLTKASIRNLAASHTLTGVSILEKADYSTEMPEVQAALELANRMLRTELTYEITQDEEVISHPISKEDLRSFITVDADGFTPILHQENVEAYLSGLGELYNIEGTKDSFLATGGTTIGLTVAYNGRYVDSDAMIQDLTTAMSEGFQGSRPLLFQDTGDPTMPYGGTYIEVNLNTQHLYFYKNGECILSTDLVSGKVAEGHNTPNGVFHIYAKSQSVYLTGEDYSSFVNYWMPFYGGYGLHDATWRSSFGGSIYLYGGSHGCVNLPYKAAQTIYANAPVGTKVIVFGGVQKVDPLTQSLKGKTSYGVAEDSGSFTLDIKPEYKVPALTYVSSNPSVAIVDANGNVTIVGPGTATITVVAPKDEYHTEATTTVTIQVHTACEEGRHTLGASTVVTPSTCLPGLEEAVCAKCGYVSQKEIPAAESHSFGSWVTVLEPTCGAEGTQERTCTKCNTQKETAAIPATGLHTEGEWTTTLEPTCIQDGSRQTQCTGCGAVMKLETIPATGVHAAGEWTVVTPPTCTEAGIQHKCCIHCDMEMETGTIAPGHTAGEWVTDTAATCTAEGKQTKSCTACGQVLEEGVLPKTEHSFGSGATCDHCPEPNPYYTEESTQ